MNNKIKTFICIIIGVAILCLYIASLFDWFQFRIMIQQSVEWMTNNIHSFLSYLPVVCIISAFIVLIKMILLSYEMGKTKIEQPTPPRKQKLLPVVTNTPHPSASVDGISSTTSDPQNFQEKEGKLQVIREKHLAEQTLKRETILKAVLVYVENTMAPFMRVEDIEILCCNIRKWQICTKEQLTPTITNGKLTTLDLRHLAWNIGERFKWTGEQRALFIKQSFPHEFRESDLPSIRRNLRQQGSCQIKLDVPPKNSHEFNS